MSGIDFIGIACVAGWFFLAIRKIYKDKKAGKCCGCSNHNGCSACKKRNNL